MNTANLPKTLSSTSSSSAQALGGGGRVPITCASVSARDREILLLGRHVGTIFKSLLVHDPAADADAGAGTGSGIQYTTSLSFSYGFLLGRLTSTSLCSHPSLNLLPLIR